MTIFTKKYPPSGFYVYLYLRNKDSDKTPNGHRGTPYYVGKGLGNRAWITHGARIKVPFDDHIQIIAYDLLDEQAKDLEKELIAKYGRIDLGNGILMNLTEGGEGVYGTSEEVRAKRRASQRKTWATPEAREKKSEATKKVWSDPEYKSKRAATIREAWQDPKLRSNHAAKIKESWSDPELRIAQSKRNQVYYSDPKNREKVSIRSREYWDDPEYRTKVSQGIKDRYKDPAARERASKASREKWKNVSSERMAEIVAKRRETIRRKKEASDK
jgi:hypothetical protein